MNETQIGLGAIPRKKDTRDYKPQALGMGAPYPDTFSTPVTNIYMQGTYGTCGAHAGAALMNALKGIVSSPKYLWKRIKQIDGFPLDGGTDMRSIFKALQTWGICALAVMDNSLEQDIQHYSDPSEITPGIDANAANNKIGSYGFIDNPTMEQIKQAIYTYKAVVLLVDCGDGWWLPSWGPLNNPLHLGNFVGHHFVVATQYGLTIIDGPNSWSTLWGDRGMFNFDSTYIPHVLELGFATLPSTVSYQFNNNLYFGMRNNPDVHALQVKLGMPTELQTGNFFWNTLLMVMGYQQANGITPTGFVGPITRAKLNG